MSDDDGHQVEEKRAIDVSSSTEARPTHLLSKVCLWLACVNLFIFLQRSLFFIVILFPFTSDNNVFISYRHSLNVWRWMAINI